MSKPTLVALAAGIGSRYGGLKQIDSVGPSGEIIIDYSVFDAVRAGFDKVVFVIRRDIESLFKEKVGDKFESVVRVEYVFQELSDLPGGRAVPAGRVKPWGTGHAILAAAPAVSTPFSVINADDFYGRSGFESLARKLSESKDGNGVADYSMVGFVLRNTLSDHGTVARGVCSVSSDGLLDDVVELTKISRSGQAASCAMDDGSVKALTGSELVSMNMWGFTPSLFDHLRRIFSHFLDNEGASLKSEFYIPTVVNSLVKSGKATVEVLRSEDPWLGITYKEDKPLVEAGVRKLVSNGVYPTPLFPG